MLKPPGEMAINWEPSRSPRASKIWYEWECYQFEEYHSH